MSELKVGDKVEIVGIGICEKGINIGDKGTIISVSNVFMGVDFDRNIGGHSCAQCGRYGYCLYLPAKYLKKIEEAEEETAVNTEETEEEVNEETKTETMEQKILKVLREEIGVEIGEEFDVYENGTKLWTCRFEKTGHLTRCHENGKFRVTFIWKYWIFHCDKYVFKKKPFMPQNGEEYFCLYIKPTSSGVKYLDAGVAVWNGISFDYGMLALGNVFRTKEEAIKSEDKLLERLNELLKGEE